MISNLVRYKKDLDSLLEKGELLHLAMQAECFPEQIKSEMKERYGRKASRLMKLVPEFKKDYQPWYSEAVAVVKQVLPDRLSDFVGHYQKPKSRKEITFENYKIEDYLQALRVTRGEAGIKIVGPDAAIPQFRQQLAILRSASARFESSLFDIRSLVQADLFDSELDAAEELLKNRFTQAAGALGGVVLERHLGQACENHGIKIPKKNPTIADFNDALKGGNVIEIPTWRFIQHLADVRNLCDHDRKTEPTPEQVKEFLAGVMKITKTLF